MGSLIGTYHLAIHGDPVAFEAAMTDAIMPSVQVRSRGVRGSSKTWRSCTASTAPPVPLVGHS